MKATIHEDTTAIGGSVTEREVDVMSIMICESCERYIDSDFEDVDEAGYCEICQENEFEKQRAYWEPLYRGEKLAGITK